jgi:hypothetical protein
MDKDYFDELNARLASYRRHEARLMAQEILDVDRDLNFSITTLSLLWMVADGRIVPRDTEMRRVTSAWARWQKAGQRLARQARRSASARS